MIASSFDNAATDEKDRILSRARIYIMVRLAVDGILLILLFLQSFNSTRQQMLALVLGIDIIGLAVYWLAVKRWSTASTYLQLILASLLIIAFDFAWGAIYFTPWLLTIPLSIAGGLIISRAGFNGLVTLSIFTIFGVYLGLILTGRVPLTLGIPTHLLVSLTAALAVVLLVLNALIESLVVYFYQTEEALLQTRAQLLYTLQELEQTRNLLSRAQNQARRIERLSTIGQIAEQLSKLLSDPLSQIEVILRDPDAIVQDPQMLKTLHSQVQSALRITEGLKEYAQLNELHIKTVNLDDLLAQEIARTHIPARIKLSIQQPPICPPIQGDPEKIRLIIHHLLYNALQAVHDGGEITIKLMPRPDGVAFSISDTGPGIPSEEAQLIFEPLYTTRTQSFGLGLAIVQRVVEMHGGYIEVESEPGQGATFTIFLPRVPETATEATSAIATE